MSAKPLMNKSTGTLAEIACTCLGTLIGWVGCATASIFAFDQYEPLLGTRASNLVIVSLLAIPMFPVVALGAAIAKALNPQVILEHRHRRRFMVCAAGFIAILPTVGLSAGFSMAWWEGLSLLALSTAATCWCCVRLALARGLLVRRTGSECMHCGYDLRGIAEATTCPECGNAVEEEA